MLLYEMRTANQQKKEKKKAPQIAIEPKKTSQPTFETKPRTEHHNSIP